MKQKKKQYRNEKQCHRRSIPSEKKKIWDRKIFKTIVNRPEIKKSLNIMLYKSTADEVDTGFLLKYLLNRRKNVFLPVVRGKDLKVARINKNTSFKKGKFGILEPEGKKIGPVSPKILEVILVPGVAFSKDGTRLGRGKGYYDRFLKDISDKTILLGVCYSLQLCRDLPSEKHDVKVDDVITEKGD